MSERGGAGLRSKLRYCVRAYPWSPTAVFLCACIALCVSLIAKAPLIVSIFCIVVCIASSFAYGYAVRMRKEWPRLHELRRAQYSAVWDAMSLTPQSAEKSAAGMTGEEALRQSGMQVAGRIAEIISLTHADDVLEIACGVGRIGWAIAPRSQSWTGCDISEKMLARARQRLSELSKTRFVQLPESGLRPIPDSSVDVVYCTNALPHFDQTERWQYVNEAFRVLRPSGRLYIDTVALDSSEGWAMVGNNLVQRKQGLEPPYVPLPSTPDELIAYFTQADFTDIQVTHLDSLLIVSGIKAPN